MALWEEFELVLMAVKLTSRGIDAEMADPDKRREFPDAVLPGFYLVMQPSGAKS